MLYVILAYHVEANVESWSAEQDAALMRDLHQVHDRLNQEGRLGPAVRLGATRKAHTLRGPGTGLGSMVRLPRPRSSYWASTWWTAPLKTPPSMRRATCVAPIPPQSTRSAPSCSIFPAYRSR
jgi:hypothetical protein